MPETRRILNRGDVDHPGIETRYNAVNRKACFVRTYVSTFCLIKTLLKGYEPLLHQYKTKGILCSICYRKAIKFHPFLNFRG